MLASSYGDAEQLAQDCLAIVETWKLRLRKGVELDELVLHPLDRERLHMGML